MFNTLPTRQMYGEENFNDFLTHLQKSIFIKSIEERECYLYINFFNGDSEIIQSRPSSTVDNMKLEYNAIMKKAAEKLSIV